MLSGKTVLIVDDVYFMRNLLKKELKEAGYEVIGEAKNGKEGIQYYFELKPDIVTMDIKMPDISGIEVTKQILSKDPNAKILAISGNTDEKVKQEILDAGALDYLQKPFQPAFLWNKLDKIFNNNPEIDCENDKKANNQTSKPNTIIFASDEEDIEDEFIIQSEPEPYKQKTLVITNDEDLIEFPEEVEDELEKYKLNEENLIEFEKEVSNTPSIEFEDNDFEDNNDTSFELESERTDTAVEKDNKNNDYYKEEPKEVYRPISIRPPRGHSLINQDYDNDNSQDMEEPVLTYVDEEVNTGKNSGIFSKIKSIFKK